MPRFEPTPDRDDVRALVAPLLPDALIFGAFFRVAVNSRGGAIVQSVRRFALERQARLGAHTYLALTATDVTALELRWSPFRVHRIIGHWPLAALAAERTGGSQMIVTFDDRRVELEAAAPGPDASDVIRRLTSS